jgi:hypothetical protein
MLNQKKKEKIEEREEEESDFLIQIKTKTYKNTNKLIISIKKMAIKNKFIGLILIIIGALPFLLKIENIANFFAKYKFLELLTPGELVYQIIIIGLGILLIWTLRPRMNLETRR